MSQRRSNVTSTIVNSAMRDGIPFGALLMACSATTIFGDKLPILALLSYLLLASIPFVVYRLQRRYYVNQGYLPFHAEVWFYGAVLNLCGALLCALGTWIMLHYLRPYYMSEIMQQFAEFAKTYKKAMGSDNYKLIRDIVDKNIYPSLAEYVMTMFWYTSFLGAVGSAITAIFARKVKPNSKQL